MLYLCGMNLIPRIFGVHTPTFILDSDTITKIVELTDEWCQDNLGVNEELGDLTIYITDQSMWAKSCYGGYDVNSNSIYIYQNRCENIKWIIKSILHEYTHYLQDLEHYDSLLGEYGYDNHPHEVEANNIMEDYYLTVWNNIKNKI